MPSKRTRNRNTPETYPVEVILRAERTNEPIDGVFGSGWNYLIKWKGWPDKDSSWEPVSSLVGGCQRLLESFWDEIGHQNLSITVEGFPAIPRAKWVAHERQLSLQSIPAPTTPRSPKKKKNNQSPRSPTKNSPKSPNKKSTKSTGLKIPPISLPSASSSAQPTWSESPPTPPATPDPISPLSPPLTPEPVPKFPTIVQTYAFTPNAHEPMLTMHDPTSDQLAAPSPLPHMPTLFPDDRMPCTPTLVPDDCTPRPTTAADVYLGSWAPANNEDVLGSSSCLDSSCDFSELVDYILDASMEELLAH